jgi:diguanylate cyclase (GGDEF)-like protein
MRRLLRFIRSFRSATEAYFTHGQADIAVYNLALLRKGSLIAIALMVVYGCFSPLMLHSWALVACYAAFAVLEAALCAVIYRAGPRPAYAKVQRLSLIFVALIMCFVTTISIFPFRDRPAIFFPLFYLLLSMLFSLPYGRIMGLLGGFQLLYLALVVVFKQPTTWGYDFYSSLTAFLLSFLAAYLIQDLRYREYEARRQLRRLSYLDDLTGLSNRRALDEELERRFAQDRPTALFFMDLDDFKRYNDRYGHVLGDDCLRQVAQALAAYAQPMRLFLARYGGEEFAAVADAAPAERLLAQAQALLQAVDACAIPADYSPTGAVTLSLGLAPSHPRQDTPRALLLRADRALYQAKAQGKHRLAYAEDDKTE